MIKKLRRKFIVISLITLALIEILIIGTLNGLNLYNQNEKTNNMLHFLADNNGKFPDMKRLDDMESQRDRPPREFDKPPNNLNEETRYVTRYFVVTADNNNSIIRVDTGHIAAINSDKAIEYAKFVLAKKKDTGYCDNYKYLISIKENEKVIVFVDCRMQIDSQKQLFEISFIIAISAFLLFSIIIILLSKKAVKPYIHALEKQKRFITNAGHEIKTPLAIISANNEVVEMVNGKNEWTQSIDNQVKRLDKLVKQLIILSKMEEDFKPEFKQFNFSDAILDTVKPFVELAKTSNKTVNVNISDNVSFLGNEEMIRHLISVLMDNAVKYSSDGGKIFVTLEYVNKNIKFSVYNDCEQLLIDDMDNLFERFYRPDNSRSRETGGYGIGLSIAKSIVELHNGKIKAKSENNGITFEVIFKN